MKSIQQDTTKCGIQYFKVGNSCHPWRNQIWHNSSMFKESKIKKYFTKTIIRLSTLDIFRKLKLSMARMLTELRGKNYGCNWLNSIWNSIMDTPEQTDKWCVICAKKKLKTVKRDPQAKQSSPMSHSSNENNLSSWSTVMRIGMQFWLSKEAIIYIENV